ncbi:hypothetical protein RUND412_009109 [Rhizina undulata]
MAQRSARARSKLDKISEKNTTPAPPARTKSGVAKVGTGGLLTPSSSSVSGGSSRNSFQFNAAPSKINKGAIRSFFDHSEKIIGRIHVGAGAGGKKDPFGNGGVALGLGLGLGAADEKPTIKKWEGGGSRGELWDGDLRGRKDLELWFPDGDTLIYLADRPAPPRNPQGLYKPPAPQPSFRVRSSVLRATESPFLIATLEESSRDQPPSSQAFHADPISPTSMDFEYLQRSRTRDHPVSPTSMDSEYLQRPRTRDHQPPHTLSTGDGEEGIQYRLYFPAPMGAHKTATLRHHLTTRNFFAILFDRCLVGITLGQALLDLVERTDLYLTPTTLSYDYVDRGLSEIESPYGAFIGSPRDNDPKIWNLSTQRFIMEYLRRREFDDVRNWPEGAAGLVVWAERAATSSAYLGGGNLGMGGIEALWREGFVHCTGMLSKLEGGGEWREISPITKALIDRASLEIQVRVANSDQRLSSFGFADMWPVTSAGVPPARFAFDKFQKFLIRHYHDRFGAWPPQTTDGRLSRMVYVQLQNDFAALYDYLVDRDASWSPPNLQRGQNTPRIFKPGNQIFRADDDNLPFTDILIAFDDRHNYPHIPHPFPLVPEAVAARRIQAPPATSTRFFHPASARRDSAAAASAQEKAAALSLSESTNIESLLLTSTSNLLVDAFARYEKTQQHEIDPHDARKGRWILIYGIIQTLATVAVDAPGVRWKEGVDYFLCAKLRGTPPWRGGDDFGEERCQFRSHCWTVPRTWGRVGQTVGRGDTVASNRSRDRDWDREAREEMALPLPPKGIPMPGAPVELMGMPVELTSPVNASFNTSMSVPGLNIQKRSEQAAMAMDRTGTEQKRHGKRDKDGSSSGEDGDDEMGEMTSEGEVEAEGSQEDRKGKQREVEDKVRWGDVWGVGGAFSAGSMRIEG